MCTSLRVRAKLSPEPTRNQISTTLIHKETAIFTFSYRATTLFLQVPNWPERSKMSAKSTCISTTTSPVSGGPPPLPPPGGHTTSWWPSTTTPPPGDKFPLSLPLVVTISSFLPYFSFFLQLSKFGPAFK
jgi:hypothetical protein